MTVTRHYVLAAGGTGGHMIPAYALGEELIARGHHVALVTDERGAQIPGVFDKGQVHVLPAGRLSGGPLGWLRGAIGIKRGRDMALRLFETFDPAAMVGFGGYPALPTLLAARKAGVATMVHEQNAVLGRVNRLVASRVDAIATSFETVSRIPPAAQSKVHLVGNPVRESIVALRAKGFPPYDEHGVLRVLVTGGSQGASVLGEVVPDGLAMLPEDLRSRLQVTQQCRAEDIDDVRARYARLGIAADLATYLEDLPERLGWAHLVIARAGASTLAELTAAGRPAVLVPLPGATDDHQSANAREMTAAGAARTIPQPHFTAKELAKQVQKLALSPAALANAATRALECGRPHATRDFADLVERVGGAGLMDVIKVGRAQPSASGALAT